MAGNDFWFAESNEFQVEYESPADIDAAVDINTEMKNGIFCRCITEENNEFYGETCCVGNKRKRVTNGEDSESERRKRDQNRGAAVRYRVNKKHKNNEIEATLANIQAENASLRRELKRSQEALAFSDGTEDVSMLLTRLNLVLEELLRFTEIREEDRTLLQTKITEVRAKHRKVRESHQVLLEKTLNLATQYAKPFVAEASIVKLTEEQMERAVGLNFLPESSGSSEVDTSSSSKESAKSDKPKPTGLTILRRKLVEELNMTSDQLNNFYAVLRKFKQFLLLTPPPVLAHTTDVDDIIQHAIAMSRYNLDTRNALFTVLEDVLPPDQSFKLLVFIVKNPGAFVV